MTDIQKSIDKLTDKISELEAQLHVANESLDAQADEINNLTSLKDKVVDSIKSKLRNAEEEYSSEVEHV